MNINTSAAVSDSVLTVIEGSALTPEQKKNRDVVSALLAESSEGVKEGVREVFANAHKVGLTYGKAQAKKALLSKVKSMSVEELFAFAHETK